MNDITININGGNNQILPNATEAVQNFYGDQFAEKILVTVYFSILFTKK